MSHYDVIIVGAGSMGMAAGYYLSRTNQSILLLDAHNPPHDQASHHGETRIIRHAYGEGEAYVPLALTAQRLWYELEQISGRSLFLNTGVLNAGQRSSHSMQTIIKSAQQYDLPLEILTAEEVKTRWSGLTMPDDYIGCFEPTSGVLKCEECIEAYRDLAVANGVDIRTNAKVTMLTARANGVDVTVGPDTYSANALIVAAGSWSGPLLEQIGLSLPLSPVRKTFAWFKAEEEVFNDTVFPAFAFDTPAGYYYGFPSIGRAGLKIGRHDGGIPVDPNQPRRLFGQETGDLTDLQQFTNTFMPAIDTLSHGKTCLYTMTPDEDFIIDLHPDYPHIAIAAGFSGHGFKFSSLVGKVLSELIVEKSTTEPIAPFSIKRFKQLNT
ncbi:N-methyl-L-tryptophan oxidase [Exiguobacterium acetylicum]|uniref:N-methyl-L-tryptophan oxidase n=1 Tax=Exiguobacterium acetylicum TaxID=41170 RepID=UPI001EE2F472|nr:N-methyl-L-tryptophan oxidase [Exiguobacterium acetylicum]UKS57329.1 N-methyl-L-tryptophan oxidase [Exiguobacterium acetylicum]